MSTSRPSAVRSFLQAAWEFLAFALTAIGALASLLVGHWYTDVPNVSAAPGEPIPPSQTGATTS